MKAYDKAEDPIYALEHNLPIDFQHYLDHHLELPLVRLFGPVMNNPKELMTGGRIASNVSTPTTYPAFWCFEEHSVLLSQLASSGCARCCAGAHTRSIALATPSTHSGGIMRFARVRTDTNTHAEKGLAAGRG